MLLPHESTVAHEQRFIMDAPMISRTRSRMALGSLSTMDSLQKVDDIKDAQVSILCGFFFRYESESKHSSIVTITKSKFAKTSNGRV